MSSTKNIIYILGFLLCFSFHPVLAQDEEYASNTEWAQSQFPTSYERVKGMVEDVWGSEDPNKVANLIELHITSLRNLMNMYEEADLKAFSKALDKWSRTTDEERMENWWHWPNTNWMKVEEEYNKLMAMNNE